MNETKLADGYIRANETCPYADICNQECKRKTETRNNIFSCGLARAFDLIHINNARKQEK